MNETDPMNFLPQDIQSILKRKSSRDPSSRFSTKLHMLLSYVTQNPDLEDKIGCAWVTEEEFRINKRVLVNVMGIKINTLNVNLHQLGFIQQKHNKDGWTLWKRPGFTKSSPEVVETSISVSQPRAQKNYFPNFTLGPVQHEFNSFVDKCKQIWIILFQSNDISKPINTDLFIEKAAVRFKRFEQPTDNACEVLRAIIAPSQPPEINFNQFCKFMAMFGPEPTIMLKIASLLSCSNNSGQWLIFDKESQNYDNFYGAFEDNQPNCLMLNTKPAVTRVYNLPSVEVGNNSRYILDEKNIYYSSWEEYFQQNQIYSQQMHSDYPYQYTS